jgi:hypothetical protein
MPRPNKNFPNHPVAEAARILRRQPECKQPNKHRPSLLLAPFPGAVALQKEPEYASTQLQTILSECVTSGAIACLTILLFQLRHFA